VFAGISVISQTCVIASPPCPAICIQASALAIRSGSARKPKENGRVHPRTTSISVTSGSFQQQSVESSNSAFRDESKVRYRLKMRYQPLQIYSFKFISFG
jgi:hypothetical protein